MGGGENYGPEEGHTMLTEPHSEKRGNYFWAADGPLSNISPSTGAEDTNFTSASILQDLGSCQIAALDEDVDANTNGCSQVISSLHDIQFDAHVGVEEDDHQHSGDAHANGCKSEVIDLVHPAAEGDVDAIAIPMEIDNNCSVQIVEDKPELTNATSILSSKTPKPRLYNLMHIKSDKQDLSFVEKVMLPQADIFDLCNRIVPGSARHLEYENKLLLNFDLLNRFSVHPVGFYGNKMVMVEIFGRSGIIDGDTLELMREGKLQPGLYGALREENLHIFYWHQGSSSLPDASRKDISCNFIRYLVELCSTVHMCLDAAGLETSLLSSKSTFTKKVRTQRLKLFVKKSSENDLKVHPGFEIHLSDCKKVLTPTGNGCSNEVPSIFQEFQLAEGYHAAAILVASVLPPKKSIKIRELNKKCYLIPSLVKQWESEYNLDVSRLVDDQFTLFLEATESAGFKDLCDLIESSNNETKVQANKTYDLDSLVSKAEHIVIEIFEKALSAYLKSAFPWEERLLSDTSTLENAQSRSQTEGEGICEENPPVSQELQCYCQNASTPGRHDGFEFDETEASYSFEQELSSLWTDKQVNTQNESELLFDGSEISFMSSVDEPVSLPTSGDRFFRFSIHQVERKQGHHLGPILYGKTCRLKVADSISIEITVRISAQQGNFDDGPVLRSQPLTLHVLGDNERRKHGIGGGILVHKSISPHPVLTWMKSFADSSIVPLRANASIVDRCLGTWKENLDDRTLQSLIPSMLAGKSCEVYNKLPKGEVAIIKKTWADAKRDDNAPNISSVVRLACSTLHKRNRDTYEGMVKSMVIDDIVPLLKQKIQADLTKQMKALKKQAQEEMSILIRKLRGNYMMTKEDLPTLSLISCISNHGRQGKWGMIKEGVKKLMGGGGAEASLSIRYSTEVLSKEDLTWNAIDIVPMKKDLEILNKNAAHVISPSLNAHSANLIDVISTETQLAKVVCLKSGQALLFLQKYIDDPLLTIYHCPRLASARFARPIKELKRPVDAIAFDEASKFAALYAKQFATIHIYFFDENYMNMEPTGIQLNLAQYSGSQNITWMRFVPGKRELVLVDAAHCVRLFELTQSVMMRPRQFQLPFPFVKACVSADGS